MKKIYLKGSFSNGKSFLAKRISEIYDTQLLPEYARIILQEWETDLKQIRKSINEVNEFQKETLIRQFKEEQEAYKNGGFVAPRGIDTLAFLAKHGTLLRDKSFEDLVLDYGEWVKDNSIVFLVRPHKELLVDDNIRDLNYEESLEITGMVQFMLEYFDIPYYIINTINMKEREDFVTKILDLENVPRKVAK